MTPIVLESWSPRGKTLEILQSAKEFAEREQPVSIRQTFYYLVTLGVISNTKRDYCKLVKILTKARKAGIIPFEWFVDRSRRPIKVSLYKNTKEFLEDKVKHYYRDTWLNQDVYIITWIEKEALEGVITPVTVYYNVPLYPGKGYSSWSISKDAVKEFRKYPGKKFILLYLGDYDPSGEDISRDLQSRFEKEGLSVQFERLALASEQVQKYNLPAISVKQKDPRATKFIQEHGDNAVELDALPPSVLRQIVEEGIKRHLNLEAFLLEQQKEEVERETLQKIPQICFA